MNLKKRGWTLSLAILLLLSLFMPDTSAAIDYRTIRVRITMNGTDLKQMNIGLNGDYMLVQNPSLSLPTGSYEIRVAEDGTNLVLKGDGIDQIVGPEIQFLRMKYSGTTASTFRLDNTVNGNRNFLGNMRFHLIGGSLVATNHVPMEEYLYGVVAYEMSNSWPLEALKAQAVSARGYAIKKLNTTRDYDIGDTASEQVYKGFEPSYTRVIQAVNETRGKVATYNGKIIDTYYAASNGGQTDLVSNVWGSNDASYPYLVMKDDPYDLRNPSSKVQTIFVPLQVAGSSYDAATGSKVVRVQVEDALNIRSGPGTTYAIIGKATNNQLFSYVSTDPNGWHKIQFYSNGSLLEGYVSPQYTTLEDNLENGYLYINPVLKDLQNRIYLKIGSTYSITAPAMIKINQITRFQNGTKRWPSTDSRSYVTAVGDATVQYKKGDGTLSEEIPVTDVSIQLMTPNGSGGYWLGHEYLDANLRLRGVEPAQDSSGATGYNVVNRRYGHGIGMSQRGAQQMANEGKTYEEIIAFYFQGTALTTYETSVPELPSRGDTPTDPQTPVPTVTTQTFQMGANSITGIQENTATADFINGFTVQNGTLTLVNASNVQKTSGPVATGDVLHVKNGNGTIVKSYSIVIYGDVNGDGKIFATDYLKIKLHIMGETAPLSGVYALAADANKDGKIFATDYMAIKNHIMEISRLSQN